jgi:error-prone DNA polymerase
MYPKRLIVDDARAFGVPVLGVDVNASGATYAVESTSQGPAIRVALSEVKGITEAEVAAIVAGQPFQSLADFVSRSQASRPIVERLVLVGGFDALHGQMRRDLLWHLAGLFEQSSTAPRSHLMLDVDAGQWQPHPTGLRPMTLGDQVKHEVEILGLDLSAHVVSFYAPMLRELGVVAGSQLLSTRSGSRILVAGAKVATQTPPIRSGKRVAFVTLDDSTGPVDATFFEEAQNHYAATLFNSWLLLVRGTVRRTGPKGVSVLAQGCWDLGTVYRHWRAGGVAAVRELLDTAPYDDNQIVIPTQVWEHASGFRQSPYADVR